jgi:signal transduction histidine kinase
MKDQHQHPDGPVHRPMFWEPSLAFLKYSVALVLAGCAAFVIAIFIFAPDQPLRILGPVSMSLVAVTAWFLLARGRVEATVHVLAFGLWAVVTGMAFFTGGVGGTITIVYPQIILLLGWMIGMRAAVAMAVLTVATTLGFALAESWGFLPQPLPTPPAMRWIVQSFVFVFSAVAVVHFLRAYQSRLREAVKLGTELALRTAELHVQTERLLIGQRAAGMVIMDWDVLKDELRWSDSPEWLRGPLPESGTYPLYVEQVHPEDRDRFRAVRAEGIDTLQPRNQEYRLVRTDGRVLWVRSQRVVLPGADGKAARMLVALQDITERKQAQVRQDQLEAQLRESQKMEALGTLAGGVAHDFNNIVATIMGNVELARQDVGPRHAAQESLEEIRKASQRAKELVQQILAFGRRQVLERKVLSLAPVVEESVRLLRSTLPAGVGLSAKCALDAPAVLADAMQVQQVLVNLCGNAWHAVQGQARPAAIEIGLALHVANGTPPERPERRTSGGRASLRPGRYACLTVSDNGSGMEQATVERIFEPFFTTKPVGEGTGLGLAVVHGIVQGHGASIAVHSVPGEGTAFRIYFPAAGEPVSVFAAPKPDGVPAQPGQTRGRHILYVDDEEAIVFLMKRLLERQGYRVSGYTDAREALAVVRSQPEAFDLVVTDYNMPGLSGLELARALRTIRVDLPVALASGYITEELRAAAPAAGVRELVYKPNTVDELCAMVARLAKTLP